MYLELYGSAICKRFLFPESNDPPKITTPLKLRPPKAANSESNEGRYYRNSTVFDKFSLIVLNSHFNIESYIRELRQNLPE